MSAPSRGRIARRLGAVAAAAILAFTLSGCAVLQAVIDSARAPVRDAETQEVVESGQADVFTLMVGDCMNEITDEIAYEVPVVPCGEAHDEEAYFEHTFAGDEYPGDDAISEQSFDACFEQFSTFAGIDYQDSLLDFYPITPTQESWERRGDRLVTCMIYDPEAQTTGTLAGAAR
ncbi:septum formation family protein [Microterricola viridarii]|uniref:Septum formation-related domain-containing protein n=1 Tax=Microterricola viridarii TaxID=412690 RepID=A0A109QYE6_9MICO|nr:septum formation family protein [Microterricola viridarii]AMB58065.1 hypothetical protein AWU67_03410 [Microterricola viridarii]